jgi:signal peptidase I
VTAGGAPSLRRSSPPHRSDRRPPVVVKSFSFEHARFWIGQLCLFGVATCALLALWMAIPSLVLGWRPVVVTSESMSPAVRIGDVVVNSDPGEHRGVGDVITFHDAGNDRLMTHRIVEVLPDGNYRTRGDANLSSDSGIVESASVTGVGRLLVPLIGFPAIWLMNGQWFALAILVLVLIVAPRLAVESWRAEHDPWAANERVARVRAPSTANPPLPRRGAGRRRTTAHRQPDAPPLLGESELGEIVGCLRGRTRALDRRRQQVGGRTF